MANCPECASEDYTLQYDEDPYIWVDECEPIVSVQLGQYMFCADCEHITQLKDVKLQLTPETIGRLQNG